MKVVAVPCLLTIVLPLLFATAFGVSPSLTMKVVGATFALECFAIPLGIALKLPPLCVFFTVVSTGIGIFILTLGIFHLLGAQSQRLVTFLLKFRGKVWRWEKYGIYGLIPGATILGVYGCAALVWFLGWNTRRSTLFTIIGFVLISAIFLFSSIGILKMISPG